MNGDHYYFNDEDYFFVTKNCSSTLTFIVKTDD